MAKASPSKATVTLVLGGRYLDEIRQLEAALAKAPPPASLAERNPATVIGEQIVALQEQMADTEQVFHLRSMGQQFTLFEFTKPTRGNDESDKAFAARWFDWTCELVSLVCVDPKLSPEQVAKLVDEMPPSSWTELSEAAWAVNSNKVSVPFSAAAYVLTSVSGETSRRPSEPESATAASAVKSPPKRRRTSTTKTAA